MRDEWIKRIAKAVLSVEMRHWLREKQRCLSLWPPIGLVWFGSLRRVAPISRVFGFDRGQCIDRYYIEQFLTRHTDDIRGRVLEIGDNAYSRRFGGDRVTKSDVLHATPDNLRATIIADLTCADHIPSESYHCIILTQTLHLIFDLEAALTTLHRILRPSGVLLVTIPGISQISRYDMDRWGDYWRFTTLSARRLFEEVFPANKITVEGHGNVLAAIAFLHGLAAQDLRQRELRYRDPDYEVVITVRAEKPEAT